MTPGRREQIVNVTIFVICLALNLGLSRVGWSHNLREVHEFRQTQTALTARYLQREGWSLAAPLPLFGPPWSAPLEFPLYQICTAKLSTWTGFPLEQTGRTISLTFFYLALPAWYLLLGYLGIPAIRRWPFLALILVTPVYLYYSRAFMIESTALCFSAWFMVSLFRATESRRAFWIPAAIFAGILAALAKVTTFAIFLVPACAFSIRQMLRPSTNEISRSRSIRSQILVGAGTILPVLAVAFAWIAYTDRIKSANPLSAFLTSQRLHEWNYGTVAQRLDPQVWKNHWINSTGPVLQLTGVAVIAAGFAFGTRVARWQIVVLFLCFLAGPLVFTNLYFLHDYYFYANGCFLLAAVVVAWNELMNVTAVPALVRWSAVLVVVALQVATFSRGYFNVQTRGDVEQPELGKVFASITRPDDVLLMYGFAWNPGIPYASDRRAIMVTDENAENPANVDEVLGRLPPDAIGALAVSGPKRHQAEFLDRLTTKLRLHPTPVLTSDTTIVFVAERLVSSAVARLEGMRLTTLSRVALPDTELYGIKVRRYQIADYADDSEFAMFSPRPTQIVAPSGVSTAVIAGRKVLNAHSPSEVWLSVGPEQKTVEADFGVIPEAYTEPNHTDGVVFSVDLVQPSGDTKTLFERYLNPKDNPADRGIQHLAVELPDGTTGQLVFRTLPGPRDDFSFDWAYWTRVNVR